MKKYFKCFVVAIIVLCSNISFAYASDIEGGNPAATYSSDGIFLSNDDVVELNQYKTLLFFNGTLITDYETIIRDDMAFVPVRFIAEELNASVGWNGNNREVTIKKSQEEMVLNINSSTALKSGKEITLSDPVIIYKDLTYVPLSFVAENLGATVEYSSGLSSDHTYYHDTKIPLSPPNTIVRDFSNIIIDEKYDFSDSITAEEAMKKTQDVCLVGLANFVQSLEENLAEIGENPDRMDKDLERIKTEINRMVYIGEVSRYFKFTIGPYDILFDRINEKVFFVIHSSNTIVEEVNANNPSLYTYVFIVG